MKSINPIVVVGAGHAGVEAAHAAARMGAEVILVTLKIEALVRLSCNPAIGGIGKGHLVREIDAMGGVMGRAADQAGIHFRVLNRSRGPAVHGPRVQQDYAGYPAAVRSLIQSQPGISLIEGEVSAICHHQGRANGVQLTDGRFLPAESVVLTTGTFLRGLLFRGEDVTPGGRAGEPPSDHLSASLSEIGLHLDRYKTGTPPRLERDSIDFGRCEPQPGDLDPEPFSFGDLSGGPFRPQLPQVLTHLAYTNPRTHQLVRSGLDRSPLFSGRIKARGPRYCPSFEDKVVKFADRERHLLHLEPMGLDHPWVYINGLSTSLPPELQEEIVHSIPGLEESRIARFGYSVEYDFAQPTQLSPSLETRAIKGLFLAGQICGTTGYEEAAGLGLVAGINAFRFACGKDPWIPDRLQCYLGVMVDDLTTRGVLEPYRMFTSRAEARLSLAPDNADRRLTPLAEQLGLVESSQARTAEERWERINKALRLLDGTEDLDRPRQPTVGDLIRRGEDESLLELNLPPEIGLSARDQETTLTLIRYRGYLEREGREIERLRRHEEVRIPEGFSFDNVPGLSTEIKERLRQIRPASLGQAARIPGVTPAAIGLMAAALNQRARSAS